jgi:hypothetical protein
MMTDELQQHRLELLVQELTVQLKVRQGVIHGTDYVEDVELCWGNAFLELMRPVMLQMSSGAYAALRHTDGWRGDRPVLAVAAPM